jgi:nucleoside-diphosphate-sugar epimerase
MAMRVAVTGAAGYLGRVISWGLADAGYEVQLIDMRMRSDLPARVEIADLFDIPTVYRVLEGCDAVVHLANHPGPHGMPPQRLYRENIEMNANVFQATVDLGIRRLVSASSVQAFAGDRNIGRNGKEDLEQPSCLSYLPIDGDAPVCPRNIYALSKATGEQQVRYYAAMFPDLSATVVRFPFMVSERHLHWHHGHGDGHHGFWGNIDEGLSYLAVQDAATLVPAILEKQDVGYHCIFPAAPDSHSSLPLPEVIEKLFPGVPLKMPIEDMTSLVDTSKITEAIGWEPKHVGLFKSKES